MADPLIPPQLPQSPAKMLVDALGNTIPPRDDLAWQPPTDPLKNTDVRAQAGIINREIPLVSAVTGWTVPMARAALDSLTIGLFDQPAQLIDSMMGDSRVQASTAARNSILGRPVDFVLPRKYRDSDQARECRDAFIDAWPLMATEPALSEILNWSTMIGFSPSQILWDTSGEYATPHPQPWHPRYTYYHWLYRTYVAITMDGQVPIIPGDGHWILHAPYGAYRGWMRSACRAIAPWWLARNYALRDFARWCERHGLPIIKALTPAACDPVDVARFRDSVANLGQETAIQLPRGVDGKEGYDIDLMEASGASWQGFIQLINSCNSEITLSLQAQNLTSEVKEGSFAAARVHADVKQALLEEIARALSSTIYTQLARPFAAMNFGNPDLAPRVIWNVQPYEDNLTAVQTLLSFTQSIYQMRNAGIEIEDVGALAKDFGIDLGRLKKTKPLQDKTSGGSEGSGAGHSGTDIAGRMAAFNDAVKAYSGNGFAVTQGFVNSLAETFGVKPPLLSPASKADLGPGDLKQRLDAFNAVVSASASNGFDVNQEYVNALAERFGVDAPNISEPTKKAANIFGYDIELGVVDLNEARERKGLPPREGGDITYAQAMQNAAPKEPGKGARARRIEPSATPRKRIAAIYESAEAIDEALAEIEADYAARDTRRARRVTR